MRSVLRLNGEGLLRLFIRREAIGVITPLPFYAKLALVASLIFFGLVVADAQELEPDLLTVTENVVPFQGASDSDRRHGLAMDFFYDLSVGSEGKSSTSGRSWRNVTDEVVLQVGGNEIATTAFASADVQYVGLPPKNLSLERYVAGGGVARVLDGDRYFEAVVSRQIRGLSDPEIRPRLRLAGVESGVDRIAGSSVRAVSEPKCEHDTNCTDDLCGVSRQRKSFEHNASTDERLKCGKSEATPTEVLVINSLNFAALFLFFGFAFLFMYLDEKRRDREAKISIALSGISFLAMCLISLYANVFYC